MADSMLFLANIFITGIPVTGNVLDGDNKKKDIIFQRRMNVKCHHLVVQREEKFQTLPG